MIPYQKYQNCGGTLDEAEFNQLEPGVCRLIESYIKTIIPYWKIRKLTEYNIDFSDVITIQIDFIAENGGVAALNGNSDFNVSSVSTKGFNYQMKAKQVPMFNNVPLSPLITTELRDLLRQEGLLSMCL